MLLSLNCLPAEEFRADFQIYWLLLKLQQLDFSFMSLCAEELILIHFDLTLLFIDLMGRVCVWIEWVSRLNGVSNRLLFIISVNKNNLQINNCHHIILQCLWFLHVLTVIMRSEYSEVLMSSLLVVNLSSGGFLSSRWPLEYQHVLIPTCRPKNGTLRNSKCDICSLRFIITSWQKVIPLLAQQLK